MPIGTDDSATAARPSSDEDVPCEFADGRPAEGDVGERKERPPRNDAKDAASDPARRGVWMYPVGSEIRFCTVLAIVSSVLLRLRLLPSP